MSHTQPDTRIALALPAFAHRGRLACKPETAELFYADDRRSRAEAAQICDRCAFLEECHAFAIATDQRHGVWGGQTAVQRGRTRGRLA